MVESERQPLVALLTPVHDGAECLAACLESVRTQDYRNWIHIVVDNASKDSTRQIAESFAARDPRLRVLSFDQLVPMLENFNRALAAVPPTARYAKQIHADDALYPGCLRAMVEAAESCPAAAIVVSRFYEGAVLQPRGVPSTACQLPGRDVARRALLGTSNLLGTPSISLLRIERIAGWPSIFRPEPFPSAHPAAPPHCQGDKEAYLSTLEHADVDVAFLPEPLVR